MTTKRIPPGALARALGVDVPVAATAPAIDPAVEIAALQAEDLALHEAWRREWCVRHLNGCRRGACQQGCPLPRIYAVAARLDVLLPERVRQRHLAAQQARRDRRRR